MGMFGRWLAEPVRDLSINEYLSRAAVPTWAGVNVNAKTALSVSAVFACVRVIAEDIGKLPFIVYQNSPNNERERATTSPFWRLLHDKPNPYMSSQQFREYLTASALLRGNGFALKNTVGGQVRELLPLHPDSVTVKQADNWELVYHVTNASGGQDTLTRKEIFHLPGLTLDGPIGISVLEYARQTVGNALGAGRHAGTFFGKGAKPSAVLKHKGQLSKDAQKRLKDSVMEAAGDNNSNSLIVLEDGLEYAPISITNKDSQFLESRGFEVTEIARWFRVPPHKVGDLSRATFSNIEQMALEYTSDTLMPWAERWRAAVNQQVIVTNSIFAEMLFDALLKSTTLERYQAYQSAAGGPAPFMTRNEIRRRENLAPLPGLDSILVPLNMGGDQPGGTEDDTAA